MNPADKRRFGGIERLYGPEAFETYRGAHICVVGLGGVGSWCAEALARSAIGRLTLIDGDTVAESNINRQLPAMSATLGRPKAEVLAERFASINPEALIEARVRFVDPDNVADVVPVCDVIVDAIDSLKAKAALTAWAKAQGIAIVVSGGVGGRIDPGAVTVDDLSRATGDALLSKLRTSLRKEYGFPAGHTDPKKVKKFGVRAVFSTEVPRASQIAERGAEFSNFGTAMPVTAATGLRLAAEALALLAASEAASGAANAPSNSRMH